MISCNEKENIVQVSYKNNVSSERNKIEQLKKILEIKKALAITYLRSIN